MKQFPRISALAFAGAVSVFAPGCGGDEYLDTAPVDESAVGSVSEGLACSTRITYGDRWIRGSTHPAQYDVAAGLVTWDGTCVNEGTNSYAVLSNGWRPYFTGNNACVMALDTTDCGVAPGCSTRVTYSPSWLRPATHPAQFDDAGGRVYWGWGCTNEGTNSYAVLSNGWKPYFSGNNACGMAFRFSGCGGLYQNPVVVTDCADPGVIHDGTQYVAACTSGGAANAFPLRTSRDLVNWTNAGVIFPSTSRPAWATGDFWAPEIHRVGTRFIAYYTARHTSGRLAIGAATSNSALGPFTDLGRPLILDAGMGMIDATFFRDTAGIPYLVWKADGNAVGQATPIYGQQLAADGLSLVGTRRTLISNNLAWEGGVVEAPWVVARGGYYYLFYSGNAYYDSRYAVGVARATSPLGPYTKLGAPIVKTNAWVGPGHNSVVTGPGGDTYMVYHAWNSGHTARVMLVDGITWANGWPSVPAAPSTSSRPMP